MGTRKNRLGEAVLTSTHNLCFGAKIRKKRKKKKKKKKTNDVNVSPSGRNCLNFGLLDSHGFSEKQNKTNKAQCSQYSGK